MGQYAHLVRQKVESFEDLDEVVVGTQRKVVQVERGKLQGEITHAMIGDLLIDMASFNLGLRTMGGSHKARTCISMVAESTDRVIRSSYESLPGDVLVTEPNTEFENRYFGSTTIIVVAPTVADTERIFASKGLSPTSPLQRQHFKAASETLIGFIPRLRSLIERLGDLSLTSDAAEFWKRAVIDAMTADMVGETLARCDGPAPSSLRVVRLVEQYLDSRPGQIVHVSEICEQLHVARRTLHRAFHEALGIGPIAYLRYRRLCAAHLALRSGTMTDLTISDLAIQNGFQNVGRFASYYHELFKEYPSETRRRQ